MPKDKKAAPVPPPGPQGNRGVVHGIIGQLSQPGEKRLAEAYLLPVEVVEPNPAQPRRSTDPELDRELAEDIRANGILEPILVRPAPGQPASATPARYQIIAGERRYRAALAVGFSQVPAIVKHLDDRQVRLAGLAENLQRADLPPQDEAAFFQLLSDEFNYSTREIAGLIHKSQSYVQARLNLLKTRPAGAALTPATGLEAPSGQDSSVSDKNHIRTQITQLFENSQMNAPAYRPLLSFGRFLDRTRKRLAEMDSAERHNLSEHLNGLRRQLDELEQTLKTSPAPGRSSQD